MSTYPANRNRIVSGFTPCPDVACPHLSGRVVDGIIHRNDMLTLTPNSGPGGSSPMRPQRWSCPSWPVVPSIYSIVPPNDGSALRHGHHFEPVDFVIDHGRGHHDAYSAGSCQRAYARGMRMPAASTLPQRGIDRIRAGVVRPRGVRNDDADLRPWARKRPFPTRPAERVVHPVCPCRSTGGSLNRDNSRGMSQECAANAAR